MYLSICTYNIRHYNFKVRPLILFYGFFPRKLPVIKVLFQLLATIFLSSSRGVILHSVVVSP